MRKEKKGRKWEEEMEKAEKRGGKGRKEKME